MVFTVVILTLIQEKHSTKVNATSPIGTHFLLSARRAKTIGKAVIIRCKSAKFYLLGCQLIWSSAQLRAQWITEGLGWVQLIRSLPYHGPLMTTVRIKHSSKVAVSWPLLQATT